MVLTKSTSVSLIVSMLLSYELTLQEIGHTQYVIANFQKEQGSSQFCVCACVRACVHATHGPSALCVRYGSSHTAFVVD
jgi:hypothetical protein